MTSFPFREQASTASPALRPAGTAEVPDIGGAFKKRAVRGGAITITAQIVNLVAHIGFTMALARLLSPKEFGLVGMVSVIVAFARLFKDFGLSTVVVQKRTLDRRELSSIYWVNVSAGFILTLGMACSGPSIAMVYNQPELVEISMFLSLGFFGSALGTQHHALLRREMRFKQLAIIEVGSFVVGGLAGIFSALNGHGYWALVIMSVSTIFANSAGSWYFSGWKPGFIFDWKLVKPMLGFGGNVTGFNLVTFWARNADNLLIGWFWGPAALGMYSRAYNFLMLPIKQINSPLGAVALPTLSRLQTDPDRFRRYFLKAYATLAGLTIPICVACFLFAHEFILLLLGAQWTEVGTIFRWLAPASLCGALINPAGWLFIASGRSGAYFKNGLWVSPLIVLSFVAGLRGGPASVAICYSIATALVLVPTFFYATRGTNIKLRDLGAAVWKPASAALFAAIGSLMLRHLWPLGSSADLVRLIPEVALFGLAYSTLLLLVFQEWHTVKDIMRQILPGGAKTDAA